LPWKEPRFREDIDSVHDNAMKLIWLKDANLNSGMVDRAKGQGAASQAVTLKRQTILPAAQYAGPEDFGKTF